MIGLFNPSAMAESALRPLDQLSDSELIANYEAAGTALTGTSMMPGAELTSRMGSGNASFSGLEAGRMELLRRGR